MLMLLRCAVTVAILLPLVLTLVVAGDSLIKAWHETAWRR